MLRIYLIALLLSLGGGAMAQEQGGSFTLSDDFYAAGRMVATDGAVTGDAFLAGERIRVGDPVGGSVHAAGRRVFIDGETQGNVYAFGQSVDIEAPVAGGVSAAGADVIVNTEVGGGLRAAGAEVRVRGSVAGGAVISGSEVELNAEFLSDVMVGGNTVSYGPEATVAGILTVFTDEPDEVSVPERVAPADRVQVRDVAEFERFAGDMPREARKRGIRAALGGFLTTLVLVAAIAALTIALVPDHVAAMRRAALAAPWRCLGVGFVTLSTLIGAGFVLAFTIIGILLTPAAFLFAGMAMMAGFCLGSYILGVGIYLRLGNPEPTAFLQKVGLAVLGAFVAGVAMLLPMLGWILSLALVLLGLGALGRYLTPDSFFD